MRFNAKDYSQGDIMKILRDWTGLTQKEFSKIMNKSKRTIEQYESGKVNYNIAFLKDLSNKFGIDIVFSKKK